MPAVCALSSNNVLKDLDRGCTIDRAPNDDGCQHKRRIAHIASPSLPGVYVPFAHHDCVHNQNISIHNRVCGEVPQPTAAGLFRMRRGASYIMRSMPKTTQEELGLFVEKYPVAKRKRYLDALQRVLDDGLSRSDADVTQFVKCEKMTPEKINPDPRSIQFRAAKYCVVLAAYLKPMEHHLYKMRLNAPHAATRSRVVGKGLNQVERATLLRRKMSAFRNPRVISLDMSRFDQHVSLEALQIEHAVYLHSNPDPLFRRLLSWQLHNTVRSRLGFKYTTRGKRMSGDMNTALGNCVQMIAMVVGAMEQLEIEYDILDDGDDCLLIVEAESLQMVLDALPRLMLECGHELKIEHVADTLADVEWCQSKPIFDGARWKFVRNPWKVMSCALVGTRWLGADPMFRLHYLAGIAQCELVLNAGVPVLQEYAKALLRNSKGVLPKFDQNSGEWWRYVRELRHRGPVDITADARTSFAQAFGISADQQQHYEAILQKWNFECGPDHEEVGNRCPDTWDDLRCEHLEFPEGKQ